jgi:Na+/melibiose symporter-like transporter
MTHNTPTSDPEGIVPRCLIPNPTGEDYGRQTHLPTDSPPIKLEPHENPLNWPATKKWSATIVIVLMTATITFSSSIHASAIGGVSKEFGCSRTIATLGVTTFLLGFATGPLLFAPLSEVWGRSLVFRITLGLFFCFNLGCALAPNVAALLMLRFLCGFFGSPTG